MRPKSEIYTPKGVDEHPRLFHMRVLPHPGMAWPFLAFYFVLVFNVVVVVLLVFLISVIATGRDLVHSIQLGGVLKKEFVDSLQKKKSK